MKNLNKSWRAILLIFISIQTSCTIQDEKDNFFYSTYIGGSESEGGNWAAAKMTTDNSGNVYLVGTTSSADFPVSDGAYDQSFNGQSDVFVSKFNQDLSKLIASTYLGGSKDENGLSIAINEAGEIYVAGSSQSTDFLEDAITENQRDTTQSDIFLVKLSSDLSVILGSMVIGGENNDGRNLHLALDRSEDIYLTGSTMSENFPTTNQAYDKSYNGGFDIFISKIDTDLKSILSSTYLGGNERDGGPNAIKLDDNDNVYITGHTLSSDFPITENGYDTAYAGEMDIYIAKLDPDLHELMSSTFFGTDEQDFSYGMTLDNNNNVFIAGHGLQGYKTTEGAYIERLNPGVADVMTVSKFSSDLSKLMASTIVSGLSGGHFYGSGYFTGITQDQNQNLYVIGNINNLSHYPTHNGAFDETVNGDEDIAITKLSNDLKHNLASTIIGGAEREYISHVMIDKTGAVLLSGSTHSSDFPVSETSFDNSHNGQQDLFLLKINKALEAERLPAFSPLFEPKNKPEDPRKLISKEPELITSVDQNQRTALHWASKSGNTALIELLISNGANINAADADGYTPLHMAAMHNQQQSINELKNADADKADKNGNTPFHLATISGNTEIIKSLADRVANIDAQNNEGKTALHLASYYRYADIVTLLLEKNANVVIKDNEGFTALHFASLPYDNRDVQKLLIDNQSDLNAVNNKNQTALHLGILYWGNFRALLDHQQNLNVQDDAGKTVLHYAANNGEWFSPYLKKMIEMGIDKSLKDNNGNTALDIARQNNNDWVIDLLE